MNIISALKCIMEKRSNTETLDIEFNSRAELAIHMSDIINSWKENPYLKQIHIIIVDKFKNRSLDVVINSHQELNEKKEVLLIPSANETKLKDQQRVFSVLGLKGLLLSFLAQQAKALEKRFDLKFTEDYPICFFSYARVVHSIFPYEGWTESFIAFMEELFEAANIYVFFDRTGNDHGAILDTYMIEGIEKADISIIWGTESLGYKTSQTGETKFNINVEIENITTEVLRISQAQQAKSYPKIISPVIPILLSGQVDDGMPPKFAGKLAIEEWNHPSDYSHFLEFLKRLIINIYVRSRQLRSDKYIVIDCAPLYRHWDEQLKLYTTLNQCLSLQSDSQQKSTGSRQIATFFSSPPRRIVQGFQLQRSQVTNIKLTFDKLSENDDLIKFVVLTGMGGTGKSCLQTDYSSQYQNEYDFIYSLPVEDRFSEQLQLLAIKLEINSNAYVCNDADEALRKLVIAILNKLDNYKRWLLILDNVPKLSSIKTLHEAKILNTSSCKRHILASTRCQNKWENVGWAPIEITPFSSKEGLSYLSHYYSKGDRQLLLDIATELGNLPLALSHIVTYINNTRCTLDKVLIRIRSVPEELFETAFKEEEYPKSVYRTLTLAVEHLKEKGDKRANVLEALQIAALLNPDCQPKDFYESLYRSIIQSDLIRYKLLKYSLIRCQTDSEYFSIHRLVQVFIRRSISGEKKRGLQSKIIKTFYEVFNDGGDQKKLASNKVYFENFISFIVNLPKKDWPDLHPDDLLLLARSYHVAFSFKTRISLTNSEAYKDFFFVAREILDFLRPFKSNTCLRDYDEVFAIHQNMIAWRQIMERRVNDEGERCSLEARKYWDTRLQQNPKCELTLRNLLTVTSNYIFLICSLYTSEKFHTAEQLILVTIGKLNGAQYEEFRNTYAHQWAQCFSALSRLYVTHKDFSKAFDMAKRAYVVFTNLKLFPNYHPNAIYVSRTMVQALIKLNKLDEAEFQIKESLDLCKKLSDQVPKNETVTQEHLYFLFIAATLAEKIGKNDEKEGHWKCFHEICRLNNIRPDNLQSSINILKQYFEPVLNNTATAVHAIT